MWIRACEAKGRIPPLPPKTLLLLHKLPHFSLPCIGPSCSCVQRRLLGLHCAGPAVSTSEWSLIVFLRESPHHLRSFDRTAMQALLPESNCKRRSE